MDGLLPETRVQVRAAFFYKQWPSDDPGGARHTDVPTMTTRTPHFAALNTGFSLTPSSVRQCVSEGIVWLFSQQTPITRTLISSVAFCFFRYEPRGWGWVASCWVRDNTPRPSFDILGLSPVLLLRFLYFSFRILAILVVD
jgi:hypothetical protein